MFSNSFAKPFSGNKWRTGSSEVSTDWWLSGGIDSADVAGVWQPKGAASYVASKINLSNPGTYDAIEGNAPAWDAINGWSFDRDNSEYLTTTYGMPSDHSGYSGIVQFSDFLGDGASPNFNYIFGNAYQASGFGIGAYYDDRRMYTNTNYLRINGFRTSGVMGIAANQGYLNGVADGGTIPSGTNRTYDVCIGCGRPGYHFTTVKISACVLYTITLTPAQVLAVSDAMAAL